MVVAPCDAMVPVEPRPSDDLLDRRQLSRQQHPGLGEVGPERHLRADGRGLELVHDALQLLHQRCRCAADGTDLGADLSRGGRAEPAQQPGRHEPVGRRREYVELVLALGQLREHLHVDQRPRGGGHAGGAGERQGARGHHSSEAGVERTCWQRAAGDVSGEHVSAAGHANVYRGGEREHDVGRERSNVPVQDPLRHALHQPGPVEQGVGREHVPDLLPGRLHVALLVQPHDLGADAGRGAVPRVGVELVEPRVGRGGERLDLDVPAAVEGRSHRLRVRRGAFDRVRRGGVQDLGQLGDVRRVLGAERRAGAGVGGP